MTLILEFERKLIFYKPGILRYAMRQAGPRFSGLQSRAQRRQLPSQCLKRGWAEARAELAALKRLRTLAPEGLSDGPSPNCRDVGWIASPKEAPLIALAHQQFH